MSMRRRLIEAVLGLGLARRDPLLVLYRQQRLWRAGSAGAQLALGLGKPVRAWREARAFVQEKGDGIRQQYGAGKVRQLLTFFWLSMRRSVQPSASATRWAYAVGRADKWDGWLSARHCTLLLSDLANRASRELRETISDKSTFPAWAAEKGLPVEPLIAVFSDGKMEPAMPASEAGVLPPVDLFAKPARLCWGVGAERWMRSPGGGWLDSDGAPVGATGIIDFLAAASQENPFILQRALRAHPSLAPLAPHALCSVRAITFLDAAGEPQLLGASLKLPVGSMIVDNISSGGMFAGIDPETGRLTRGFRVRADGLFEPTATGPDGAIPLAGFPLEQWPDVRAVALAAQRAVAPIQSVGWDIGLTPDGPVLIEANIGWSALTILLATERPVSESGFPEAFMHHWRATEPRRAASHPA